jgi:hypothetical protein
MTSLVDVPGGEWPEPSDPTPGVAPPPGTFPNNDGLLDVAFLEPEYGPCESCGLRPWTIIDGRFGGAFGVCPPCYEGI